MSWEILGSCGVDRMQGSLTYPRTWDVLIGRITEEIRRRIDRRVLHGCYLAENRDGQKSPHNSLDVTVNMGSHTLI